MISAKECPMPTESLDLSSIDPICRLHGILRLRVFGSMAQGTASEGSDIDLLVDLEQPIGFFELVALERELTEALGRRVDLQTEAALSPYLRDAILRDARVIYAA
jgi:predicted nucleotidyltransferase